MTITCKQLDDLLLDGSEQSLALAAQHAESCAACMERLAGWSEISMTARDLQTTWKSDLLWPRIERAIRDDQRRRRTSVWQIAAALLLLAALGTTAWLAQRRAHVAEFDNAILKAAAIDDVERAEQSHIAAINHLVAATSPALDQPSTPLLVSYKEKLMMLDDAIAECQGAINRNRQNAYLRTQLLTMYSEKQRTLQDVIREEQRATNQ